MSVVNVPAGSLMHGDSAGVNGERLVYRGFLRGTSGNSASITDFDSSYIMNMIPTDSTIANPGEAANDSGNYWGCCQNDDCSPMYVGKIDGRDAYYERMNVMDDYYVEYARIINDHSPMYLRLKRPELAYRVRIRAHLSKPGPNTVTVATWLKGRPGNSMSESSGRLLAVNVRQVASMTFDAGLDACFPGDPDYPYLMPGIQFNTSISGSCYIFPKYSLMELYAIE